VAEAAVPLSDDEAAGLFEPDLKGAKGVVVAVSGGPDSMALLTLLAHWQARPPLFVATIDHGLRPESASEASMVARFAASLGLPHATCLWTGVKPTAGLQEAARDTRLALLAKVARENDCDTIVTAHHREDQAETILMRLIAGSGIAGLAGMQRLTLRGGLRHVRPFLNVPKARLVATCAARDVAFISDPSNRDERFTRARLRGLQPLLAAEGLTVERLTTLGRRAARAEEALAAMAREVMSRSDVAWKGTEVSADWAVIDSAPEEIRLRVLVDLFRQAGGQQLLPRLEQLEVLAEALHAAAAKGGRLRRSLGARLITLSVGGRISLTEAPPRRNR
jgi:tRNA(Ile)-lysidine synthase